MGESCDWSFIKNITLNAGRLLDLFRAQMLPLISSLGDELLISALINATFHTSSAPDNFLFSIVLSGSDYGLWILYLICWLLHRVLFCLLSHFSKLPEIPRPNLKMFLAI